MCEVILTNEGNEAGDGGRGEGASPPLLSFINTHILPTYNIQHKITKNVLHGSFPPYILSTNTYDNYV